MFLDVCRIEKHPLLALILAYVSFKYACPHAGKQKKINLLDFLMGVHAVLSRTIGAGYAVLASRMKHTFGAQKYESHKLSGIG